MAEVRQTFRNKPPEYVKYFNVIDSFDTHAKIPEHFAAVDAAAKANGNVGIISVGWDPGMFSLTVFMQMLYFQTVRTILSGAKA